jgi:DHA1 family bicyclomycin/chloramphenicol resistance-like MFS transporter
MGRYRTAWAASRCCWSRSALYALGTIVCASAQSIDQLIAARFVQALGGAGSIVLARAVVRDIYSGVRAGRELSLMGAITASRRSSRR